MNTEIKTIWLTNYHIHEHASLEPNEFLEKTTHIEGLRTKNDYTFTLYPTHKREVELNNKLWSFVQGNYNATNNDHIYASIELPFNLFLFLRYHSKNNLKKHILFNLAFLFIYDEGIRDDMKRELLPDYYNDIIEIVNFKLDKLKNLIERSEDEYFHSSNETAFPVHVQEQDLFDKLIKRYQISPLFFDYMDLLEFGKFYPFRYDKFYPIQLPKNRIKLRCSYFNENDWNDIILGNSKDKLNRAESETEPLRNFLHDYKVYYDLY